MSDDAAGPPASGPAPIRQPVLVVMGVSGSGKSTVAGLLAERLGWDFGEGDALHPVQNVEKMAAGLPLTDDDRWPWLGAVAGWIAARAAAGVPAVITCSALKRSYRSALRAGTSAGQRVVFVLLHVDRGRLTQRMATRSGHFMPASLLDSQLGTLEAPTPDEDALVVEAGGEPGGPDRTPDDVVAEIIDRLALRPSPEQPASG